MTQLIHVLYDYALECQLERFLDDPPQHLAGTAAGARQYAALKKRLDEDGQQYLEEYAEEVQTKHAMEQEALFRAGLSMGMALSRL